MFEAIDVDIDIDNSAGIEVEVEVGTGRITPVPLGMTDVVSFEEELRGSG